MAPLTASPAPASRGILAATTLSCVAMLENINQ